MSLALAQRLIHDADELLAAGQIKPAVEKMAGVLDALVKVEHSELTRRMQKNCADLLAWMNRGRTPCV